MADELPSAPPVPPELRPDRDDPRLNLDDPRLDQTALAHLANRWPEMGWNAELAASDVEHMDMMYAARRHASDFLAMYDGMMGNFVPMEPPTNVDVPYVSGNGVVGGTLSATMGNWTGEPTSYSYLWKSDAEILTGIGSMYIVTASDVGKSITCVVTATNAAGSTAAPPSNAVEVTETAMRAAKEPVPEKPAVHSPDKPAAHSAHSDDEKPTHSSHSPEKPAHSDDEKPMPKPSATGHKPAEKPAETFLGIPKPSATGHKP